MNDLEIREYEQDIVDAINSKPLPLEVKRLIVAEILRNINDSIMAEVQKAKENEENG
jgi:hypothetical protein